MAEFVGAEISCSERGEVFNCKCRHQWQSFLDLLRAPDEVTAFQAFDKKLPAGRISLTRSGSQWAGAQVVFDSKLESSALVMTLAAPSTPVAAIHVRWRAAVDPGLQALGEAWERSYGDLGWRNLIPERVMPWYVVTYDGLARHGLDLQGVALTARM